MHLVLLGDSIFDNGNYTAGGPDVIAQVREILPRGWQASLLAVDGATTDDIPGQMLSLPETATHIALSVGGNDALMQIGVLDTAVATTAQGIGNLSDVVEKFEMHYRSAVDACATPCLPLVLCTIYNGCFPDDEYQRVVTTTIAVFNDVIIRAGMDYGLRVLDLRPVCSQPADYANPIEPSSIGGRRIARALVEILGDAELVDRRALLYGG